jgi:hypothetical protein
MAESAQPPPPDDPKAPQRETLRVSLPPRPLKPASTKITPRPNISAATTLPMQGLEPTPVPTVPPAWSTAVTKPIPNLSRPPSGAIPQLPPKAPPVSGAPPGSKTSPLFPPRPQAKAVETDRPPTTVIPNPGVAGSAPGAGAPAPSAAPPVTGAVPGANTMTSSGQIASRVVVASPQAKVFLEPDKSATPEKFEPIPHQATPPNLAATSRVNIVSKSAPTVSLAPGSPAVSIPTPPPSLPAEAKAPPALPPQVLQPPQPLAPQPPLSTPPEAKSGITVSPGRPQLPGGGTAPVQVKRPTSSLRLVDLPVNPGSQVVTQPLDVTPAVAPPVPMAVAQSAPILTPVVKPPVPIVVAKESPAVKPASAPILPPPMPPTPVMPPAAVSPAPIAPAPSPLAPPVPEKATRKTTGSLPSVGGAVAPPLQPVKKKTTGGIPTMTAPMPAPGPIKTASMPAAPQLPIPSSSRKTEPVPAQAAAPPTPPIAEEKKTAILPLPPGIPSRVEPAPPLEPVKQEKKTSVVPPPPPPTKRIEAPPRPSTVTPGMPVVPGTPVPVTAVTAPVDVDEAKKKTSSVAPPRVTPTATSSLTGTPPVAPVAVVPPPKDKTSAIVPPRRTQALPVQPTPVKPGPPVPGAVPVVKPNMPSVAATGTPLVKPVMPVILGAKPLTPGGPAPIKPIMPVIPGAAGAPSPGGVTPMMPVKPIASGATTRPVEPVAPSPLKPSVTTPSPAPSGGSTKSGTSPVKGQPPKETARITVKPTLPGMGAAKPVGNISGAKTSVSTPATSSASGTTVISPAAVTAGAAAVAAGSVAAASVLAKPKPAAAVVSTGKTPSTPATPPASVPVPSMPAVKYDEAEGSTALTTGIAAGLVALTWGTALFLLGSVYGYF